MKTLTLILCLLLLPFGLYAGEGHKAGDGALMFTFYGLDAISLNGINEGIGFRYFLAAPMSVRGTVGGKFIFRDPEDSYNVWTSATLLFSLADNGKMEIFAGPQAFFNHTDPNVNWYGLGGVIGFDYMFWDYMSLGGEYAVKVTRDAVGDVTTVDFGRTGGRLNLSAWF